MSEWMPLIRDVGVPLALVVFFVWQSKLREDRMTKRMDELEDYQRNRMETALRENTSVMLQVKAFLVSHMPALRPQDPLSNPPL